MSGAPTVGIVGAGQLARMTAQAALSLDVPVRLLADAAEAPARAASPLVTEGDVGFDSLEAFSRTCDVVTFDHEGVDPDAVAELEALGRVVRPSSETLRFVVDKAVQRRALSAAGFPLPPFVVADGPDVVRAFVAEHGPAVVVKAATGGYDGRGVWFVEGEEQALAALADAHGEVLLEPRLRLERELAVLVARRPSGEAVVYPVVETVQDDGICVEVHRPPAIPEALAEDARSLAVAIAEHVGATGILAVELFVVDGRVLVNELAARPHNSGHLTIEGSVTSQFENHVRAVLDWPLGATTPVGPAATMVNVIAASGDVSQHDRLPAALGLGPVHVHLYGKRPRAGRKVGHVTVLGDDHDDVTVRARRAADVLIGRDGGGGA